MENRAKTRNLADLVEKTLRHGAKAIAAFFVFLLVLEFWPAHAGSVAGTGGATEITQIKNNVEMTLQSIQAEVQTVQQIEQTYLQRLQQLKESIGPYTSLYQKTLATYQNVQNAQAKLASLGGELVNLDGALEQRFRQFGASTLSWNGYVAREGMLIEQGNRAAIAQIKSNQQILASVRDSMDSYQQAAAGMEASTGTHQATRMLGAQLHTLGGDLNKLISITAQANSLKGLEMQEAAAEREKKRANAEQIREMQRILDEKSAAALNAIITKAESRKIK